MLFILKSVDIPFFLVNIHMYYLFFHPFNYELCSYVLCASCKSTLVSLRLLFNLINHHLFISVHNTFTCTVTIYFDSFYHLRIPLLFTPSFYGDFLFFLCCFPNFLGFYWIFSNMPFLSTPPLLV